MKKSIITIIILLNSIKMFAFGTSEVTKKCELMSLSQDNISLLNKGGCRYAFQLNGKERFAYLEKCPKPFKNKYVYIRSNAESLQLDDMEVVSKSYCDPTLYKNLKDYFRHSETNETLSLLKKNMKFNNPMTFLNKIHFYRIRTKEKVWTYHYTPGVSVDIETTGEMCAGKICMNEDKQKFSKVLKTYIDFIWMNDQDEVYYSSALDQLDKSIK